MAEPHKIWIEQCEAARRIEADFGTPKALAYLIDEKFINFLEVADDDPNFRAEIPAFVGDQIDLRAVAACRVSGNCTPNRAVRFFNLR